MNSGSVLCPGCHLPLPGSLFGTTGLTTCPACDRRILVEVFPALFRPLMVGKPGDRLLEEGLSSCFYHEQKKAVTTCDGCGRFLCALCDVEFNDQHLCPSCLQTGQVKGKIASLETHRIMWDSASLGLCLLPLLIWPLTLLTAPAAFGCAIYSFFKPGSLVPRLRYRAYLAMFFSLLQIVGWILILSGGAVWMGRALNSR
ncbi:MAG TPA: hypothetical protein VNU68_00665 [Verrucomicrobiae bacterium]|jgi:hypothetical protein|nr:hypothetical protein [Verrucomicrobiae bacterium]